MLLASAGIDFKTVLTVVALVASFGAAYVYFAGSKSKGLIDLYKAEMEAQKSRADRIESECAQIREKVAALESANQVLAHTISGTAAVKELEQTVKLQHMEMMGLFTSFLQRQVEIIEKGHF